MTSLKTLLAAAALATVLAPAEAQVYKCADASGQLRYSDQPCPGGQTLDRSRLNANTMDGTYLRQKAAEQRAATSDAARSTAAKRPETAQGGVCPDERQIRNMETTLSSISLGQQEKQFMAAEVRRSRACNVERSNYSATNWKQIFELHAEQRSLKAEDRARARQLAESIHAAAASDRENARMQTDQMERAQRAAARREAAQQQAPKQIASCDAGGCWTTSGERLNRVGTQLLRSNGRPCVATGQTLVCQ